MKRVCARSTLAAALFGIFPVIGTFQYTEVFNEKQKLAHRF
jgi:hypothetical protein